MLDECRGKQWTKERERERERRTDGLDGIVEGRGEAGEKKGSYGKGWVEW